MCVVKAKSIVWIQKNKIINQRENKKRNKNTNENLVHSCFGFVGLLSKANGQTTPGTLTSPVAGRSASMSTIKILETELSNEIKL